MDEYVEVTARPTSWFSKIAGAFRGMIFGGIFFIASFPILFYNEGRAVDVQKSLQEGAQAAKSVRIDKVNPANEGKLIHASGDVKNPKLLFDQGSGVKRQGLRLSREVSMYQWAESKNSQKTRNASGGEETKTTYTYKIGWQSGRIDSNKFKIVNGHENPAIPIMSSTVVADSAAMGAFSVPEEIVMKIGSLKNFVPNGVPETLKTALTGRTITLTPNFLYVGNSPENQEIGDMKIEFKYIPNSPATIVAAQMDNSFGTYTTSNGKEIMLVEDGSVGLKTMFKRAETRNSYWTWGLRFLGVMLMFMGLSLILGPLVAIADVLPFLGSVVSAGAGIVALLLSLCLSSITIATAWVFYRPIIGIGLLAAASGCFYLLSQRRSKTVKESQMKSTRPTSRAA